MGRVLLIEDDPTVGKLVLQMARVGGYEVDWVGSLADAERHIADSVVAIIEMSPLSERLVALRALRARGLRTIAMSGHSGILLTARDEGADALLEKPFRLAALLECLALAVGAESPGREA